MSSFDSNGNYNKTNWKTGDKITADKLNKIEESLEIINNNDIERHKEADERLEGLSAQLAHNAKKHHVNNEKFTDTLKRNTNFINDLSIKCNNIPKAEYEITYKLDNDNYIQYKTTKASTDAYMTLNEGNYCSVGFDEYTSENTDATNLEGNWNTNSSSNYYATVKGATFKARIKGGKILFNFYGDTRGGVWKFILNNDIDNPVIVSTYRAVASNYSVTLIETDNDKFIDIKAEFLGDDPNNPPSSGEGTSRGWIKVLPQVETITRYPFKPKKIITPLYGQSNKEFAIFMKKKGAEVGHFFPLHDTPTSFFNEDMKIVLDGKTVTLKEGERIEGIKDIKFIQNVYAKNPETVEKLANAFTITNFKNNGEVIVDGKIEFLEDLEMGNGFGIMFPINNVFSDKVLTNMGNTYNTNLADGSLTWLRDETDICDSYISLSSSYKNLGVACTFLNPKETLRQGKDFKNDNEELFTYIQNRDTSMIKVYSKVYENKDVPKGEIFRFSGCFFIGCFEGLYNIF